METIDQIYRRHASAVFRFAWGLCGDRAQAEDLVSETFVRLLTRAPKIRTQTALGYLLAIARNAYLTSRARERREVPLVDDFPARAADPDQQIDDRARLEATLAALTKLPEEQRAALLLRVDHDLSYEDIAAALNISVSTAKVRVHRARVRLAEVTQKKGSEP